MIFCSRNEDGVPAWKLVLDGTKTVTRRKKPMEVGKEFAICPGRGKRCVCRARVVSCVSEEIMRKEPECAAFHNIYTLANEKEMEAEAHREGFKTMKGLRAWLEAHNPPGTVFYRIEFKVL